MNNRWLIGIRIIQSVKISFFSVARLLDVETIGLGARCTQDDNNSEMVDM